MHQFVFLLVFLLSFSGLSQGHLQDDSATTQKERQTRVDTLVKYVRKEFYKKNYDNAIQIGEEAKALALAIEDHKAAYTITSFMGNAFLMTDDTIQAKRIFTENLKKSQRRGDSSNILGARIDLANIYALQKDYDPAISNFKLAIPLAKKLKDTSRLFILNYNIGELYLDLENVEQADYYINETGNYLENLKAKTYHAGFELLLGRLYYVKKMPDEAIKHFRTNIELAKASGLTDAVIEGYEYSAKAEALRNNYKAAYELQQQFELHRAEKYKTDKIAAIETVTAKFNLKQVKQELKANELRSELSEQKASRNKNLLFWVLAACGILAIYLVSLMVSFRNRKKLLIDLKDKNIKYLRAKEKSEELADTKSRFFSNISHELRTPLYGIIGISSILMDDEDLKEHKDDVKSLKFSADYLLALINDVLQLNKLDATKSKKLNKSSFHLKDLVEGIIKSFEFMRLQNNNTFDVTIDPRIPEYIEGDHVKLSQVLMNLIGNSCKFTENGAISLSITAQKIDGVNVQLAFDISDTGIGISEEKQRNIFDEFTQVSERTNYQGTGLGLPIVKKLLDLHDSTITLTSEVGVGTRFHFLIWYEKSSENDQPTVLAGPHTATSIEGKKILVVDDNRINQIVTQKILEKHGAECMVADDGRQAIEAVKDHQLDLVLMDINMPDMNGFTATEAIRKFNTSIPIIALTAVEIEEMQQRISASSMNDAIVKPYDVARFIDTIIKNFN